jgi:CSLREA domain-containing protein
MRLRLLLPAVCLILACEARALTFTVNSAADAPAGGDLANGVCETAPGNGVCTLRAALQKANAFAGGGVVIAIPAGTYVRASTYPAITGVLALQGAGLGSTIIDAGKLDFGLIIGLSAAVTVSGVTIRNAAPSVPGAIGSGLINHGALTVIDSQIADNGGGGVWNDGTMTLRRSSVVHNSGSAGGGGIHVNDGTVTIVDSLIAFNTNTAGGAGIVAQNQSKATLINSTVSNNLAIGNTGGGGGIHVAGNSLVEIFSSTIAGNVAAPTLGGAYGGGIQIDSPGLVRLQSSLLAYNYVAAAPSDCSGLIQSLDHNLLQTTSGCVMGGTTGHNQVADPLLDALRLNGGPTLTRALRAASPAIDAIPVAQCTDPLGAALTTDQRGATRPSGALCDIGAVEGGLPATVFNVNLIRNGDAEQSAGASDGANVGVPNWSVSPGGVTVVAYGAAGGFPTVGKDVVQGAHGSNFFAGGPSGADQLATQSIDLAAGSAAIDSGAVRFYLSGDFGGYLNENDFARLAVVFEDVARAELGARSSIGDYMAAFRNNKTGLFGAIASGAVPVGARYAALELSMGHRSGAYTDGYADNLRLILSGGPNTPDLDQHGLTGSWYEPATSGQGFEVEIYADMLAPGSGLAFVSWFTFDAIGGAADRQRWYTMSGPVIKGQPVANLAIYENTNGSFNAPPITNANAVGTATLSFDTCMSGVVSYNFTDGSGRAGVVPLTRLTSNVTCSTTAARATNADFALSGNWFDPATSGQGLTIEVNPSTGIVFAGWYTYPPAGIVESVPRQRWFTVQGALTPGMRSIPVQLYETTGGLFDAQTFPAPNTLVVGTQTLAFQSCTSAKLDYNFSGGTSAGKSGSISLVRVGPVPPGCA